MYEPAALSGLLAILGGAIGAVVVFLDRRAAAQAKQLREEFAAANKRQQVEINELKRQVAELIDGRSAGERILRQAAVNAAALGMVDIAETINEGIAKLHSGG